MLMVASAITPSAVARIETPKLATMRLLIAAILSPCIKATKASEQGSLRYHFASALVSREARIEIGTFLSADQIR